MIRLLLVFLGALMSIHAFGANTTFLCLPHWASHPSRLTTTEPAASPVTVDEIGLSTEVIPYSGMVTGSSQLEGARPISSGAPDDWQMALTAVVKQAGKTGVGTWTYSDGTDDYGQIPPWVLTGIVTGPCVTGGAGYQQPQGHTLPDGRIVVVYEDWLANTTSSVTLDPQTEEFSAPSVVRTHDTAFTVDVHPSPAIWSYGSNTASGVLLMAASMYVDGSGTSISIDYSTDAGANWLPLGVSNLTLATGSYDYDKMSIAYDPCSRQLTMCIRKVDGGTTTIETYVSDENGQTWTHLTNAGIEATDYSMTAYNGAIVRVWITATNRIKADAIGQNMTSWTVLNANITGAGAPDAINGHLAIVKTESDTLAVYFREYAQSSELDVILSSDGGKTWGARSAPYVDSTAVSVLSDHVAGALTEGLSVQAAVASSGKVIVLGGLITAGGTDNSIVGLVTGGITNVTPAGFLATGDLDTYYPVAWPSNKSAQYSYAGGSSQGIGVSGGANSRLVYEIGSGNSTGVVTHAATATPYTSRSALWVVDATNSAGGSSSSITNGLQLVVFDGGATYYSLSVGVNFTARTVRAYESNNALAAAVTYPAGDVLEIFADADGLTLRASAWYRVRGQEAWTPIIENGVLASADAGPSVIRFGKIIASTSNINTLLLQPSLTQGFSAGVTDALVHGIESTPQPLILPQGPGIQWTGSPLRPGNTWAINAVSSQPISRTSPWSVAANPSLIWQGSAGSAGATYIQQVADTDIATPRVLTDQLGYIGWSNAPGIESVELIGWDGAAWDSLIDASTVLDGFDGVVGISYEDGQLYPYSYTGTSREYEEDELAGHWAYWTDGTHEMAGLITHNTVGRWSSSASAIGMGITIDEDSRVVIAGADEAFTDSTGTLRIYSPQGIGIQYLGGSPITQYAGVRITMAPGATIPSGGLYAWGPAVPFSRQERDGSSWEYAGTDDIVQAGMTTRARRVSRINRRTIELPFEQILSHEGEVVTSATTPNYQSWNGSTPRARVDNNIAALRGALRTIGQRALIGVAMAVEVAADPTSPLVVLGQRVMFGRSSAGLTVTAGRGQVHAPGSGHQRGTSITITEEG